MKKTKFFLCATGILMVVLGIVCLCNPVETLFSSAWMIGVITLAMGISSMVFTFKTQFFLPNSGTRMLSALFEILIGMFFLFHPLSLTVALPYAFAIWVVVESLNLCILSFDYKRVGFGTWWCMLLLGVAGMVLGISGLYHPAESGHLLAILIGLSVIMVGFSYLTAFFGLKYFEKQTRPLREAVEQVKANVGEGERQFKEAVERSQQTTTDTEAEEMK